ncbi:MAG TPA: DUF1646 family protein [Methanoregula sp.]|nr:DUF1646 family protein [Methanoregula sp.]
MDLFANLGLLVIFALVLILPFKVKCIEHNLEVFLFVCGVAALTISGFITIPGEQTGWSLAIVQEALFSLRSTLSQSSAFPSALCRSCSCSASSSTRSTTGCRKRLSAWSTASR